MKMKIIWLLMIMENVITITLIIKKLIIKIKVTLKLIQEKNQFNGFELLKSIKHKYSVRVRFHPSAKMSCINDHVKPVIRNQETDHIILHTGTNDLSSDKTPVQICNDNVNLVRQLKTKI